MACRSALSIWNVPVRLSSESPGFGPPLERAMDVFIRGLRLLRRFGQKAGPYLMLEILMPGGTLLALLLFLYQRRLLERQ